MKKNTQQQVADQQTILNVAKALNEYGEAFRGDWSDIDGRGVRTEMGTISAWLTSDTPVTIDTMRNELGLCPNGDRHWEYYCRESGCEVAA